MCLDWEEGVQGLWIQPGQIRRSGASKPLPVEPSICGDVGQPVEMVDVATAEAGMVRKLRSCRDPKEKEAQIACCVGDLFHTDEENWECPGPLLAIIRPTASMLSP